MLYITKQPQIEAISCPLYRTQNVEYLPQLNGPAFKVDYDIFDYHY